MSSLSKQMFATVGSAVLLLVLNVFTGVLAARSLGTAGRGEVAALGNLIQILGFLAALGANEATVYLTAQRPRDAPRIVGTALAMAAVLGTLGLLLVEILLPFVLAAQSDELLLIGRVFALSIYLHVLNGVLFAVIAGLQQFRDLNIGRLIPSVIYLLGLVLLVVTGQVTVLSVLAASVVSVAVTTAWALTLLIRTVTIGRPSMELARAATRYGLRVQGGVLAALGNYRLDLTVMPAVVVASSIGLYSVAANVASVIPSVVGSLNVLILAVASGKGQREGVVLITRTLRLALFGGLAVALPLFVAAPDLLSIVYGPSFEPAALSLRILLPGVVLGLGTGLLTSGLQAMNRPLASSAPHFVGLAITIGGLAFSLPRYGISGAAWTSTASYSVTFFFALRLMAQEEEFSVTQLLSFRLFLADVVDLLRKARRSSLPH